MDYARHNLIWINMLAEPFKLSKVIEFNMDMRNA